MNESKTKTVFQERDEALWLMNKTSMELNQVKAQLAATEEALAQVQRESAELRTKYHAIKKVADAAYAWQQGLQSLDMLEVEIREYRAALVRPTDVEPDPCALVFYDMPEPLSLSKQAAIERGIAKVEKIEQMWETN